VDVPIALRGIGSDKHEARRGKTRRRQYRLLFGLAPTSCRSNPPESFRSAELEKLRRRSGISGSDVVLVRAVGTALCGVIARWPATRFGANLFAPPS